MWRGHSLCCTGAKDGGQAPPGSGLRGLGHTHHPEGNVSTTFLGFATTLSSAYFMLCLGCCLPWHHGRNLAGPSEDTACSPPTLPGAGRGRHEEGQGPGGPAASWRLGPGEVVSWGQHWGSHPLDPRGHVPRLFSACRHASLA